MTHWHPRHRFSFQEEKLLFGENGSTLESQGLTKTSLQGTTASTPSQIFISHLECV